MKGEETIWRRKPRGAGFWALTLLLAVAGLVLVGWLTTLIVRDSVRPLVASRLQTTLEADAVAIRMWLEHHENVVRQVGYRVATTPAGELPKRLSNVVESLRGELGHYNARAMVIDHPSLTEPIAYPTDVLTDVDVVAGQGHLRFAKMGSEHVLLLSEFIPGSDGQATVTMVHAIEPFSELLNVARFGRSGENYAVDAEGRLVSDVRFTAQLEDIGLVDVGASPLGLPVRDPGANLLENTLGSAPPPTQWDFTRPVLDLREGRDGQDLAGYRDYRGVEVVGTWKWLGDYGIGIIAEVDQNEAFAAVETLERIMLGILAVLILAGLLGIVLVRRREREARAAELAALEDLLIMTHQQFDEIFEQVPVGVAVVDADGRIVRGNPSLDRILGEPWQRLEDTPLWHRVGSDDDTAAAMSDAVGPDETLECRLRQPDGTLLPVLIRLATLRGSSTAADLYLMIVEDVSVLSRSHERLERLRRRHEVALESTGVGVLEIDVREGRVTWYKSMCRLMGIDAASRVMSLDEALEWHHPDERELVRSNAQKRWQGEEGLESGHEYRMIRADGRVIHVLSRARVYRNTQGEPVRLVGSILDITERKATEQELTTARKQAEAANMAKSRLLANISHELRTPLHAIQGFAELLDNEATLAEGQRERVQEIQRAARALNQLIGHILEFASAEDTPTGEMAAKETKLHQGFEELDRIFANRCKTKGLGWTVDISERVPSRAILDPEKLRRTVGQLVGNAVKFTDEGSVEVRIDARKKDDRHWLVFEVKDTGAGMEEAETERIFEGFEQLGGEGLGTGVGLGLTMARSLARMMGGEITVSSAVGQGTCFRLTVPMVPVEAGKGPSRISGRQAIDSGAALADQLENLPGTTLKRLSESVQEGDLDRFTRELDKVAKIDKELSERLQALAKELNYRVLLDLFPDASEMK